MNDNESPKLPNMENCADKKNTGMPKVEDSWAAEINNRLNDVQAHESQKKKSPRLSSSSLKEEIDELREHSTAVSENIKSLTDQSKKTAEQLSQLTELMKMVLERDQFKSVTPQPSEEPEESDQESMTEMGSPNLVDNEEPDLSSEEDDSEGLSDAYQNHEQDFNAGESDMNEEAPQEIRDDDDDEKCFSYDEIEGQEPGCNNPDPETGAPEPEPESELQKEVGLVPEPETEPASEPADQPDKAAEQIEGLQQEISQLNKERKELQELIDTQMEELSGLRSRNEDYQTLVSKTRDEQIRLEKNTAEYKKKTQALTRERDILLYNIGILKRELDARRKVKVDEVVYMSKQSVEQIRDINKSFESTINSMQTLLKENMQCLFDAGGIAKPQERSGAKYYLWKYPSYLIRSTLHSRWFRTFLLMLLPTLLFLSTGIIIRQQKALDSFRIEALSKSASASKYEFVKGIAGPGSKLEEFCYRLDTYYESPDIYQEEIDSLAVIIKRQKK